MMNTREPNILDNRFRSEILPSILGCKKQNIDLDLLEQRHQIADTKLVVDTVVALLFSGFLEREVAYRELAALKFNRVDELDLQSQQVVRGSKHVIEDLDDNLGFDLSDGVLEADLTRLHQQCIEKYCGS